MIALTATQKLYTIHWYYQDDFEPTSGSWLLAVPQDMDNPGFVIRQAAQAFLNNLSEDDGRFDDGFNWGDAFNELDLEPLGIIHLTPLCDSVTVHHDEIIAYEGGT